jgi:hypothetical protein
MERKLLEKCSLKSANGNLAEQASYSVEAVYARQPGSR